MHRFRIATCRMRLALTPVGPWMVRGEVMAEPFTDHRGQPGQRLVLQPLRDRSGDPLLPASSLKGVLRSTAEYILRSMANRDDDAPPLADDPFVHPTDQLKSLQRAAVADSELEAWNKVHSRYPSSIFDTSRVYRALSPASQLFGATLHAGLVQLDDARVPARTSPRRSHVALDRFTGGVGEGPFLEQLVSDEETLETSLTIRNFALWQLGLLALVFEELNRGFARLGAGTHKGQGEVRVLVPEVALEYDARAYHVSAGVISPQARLRDAPWHAADVPDAVYAVERGLVLLPQHQPEPTSGWRTAQTSALTFRDADVTRLFQACVAEAWNPWIDQVVGEAGHAQ